MHPYKVKGKKILFCPGCKRVYENIWISTTKIKQKNNIRVYLGSDRESIPKYYPGLASYGLTREICPECISRAVKAVKLKGGG